MNRKALACALLVLLSACYHATVTTGLPAGNDRIEKRWAASWLGGLVPPSTVESQNRCPNGVAKVDVQLSFLNQVAAWLSLGIYTPVEIIVQCAAAATRAVPPPPPLRQ